MFNNIILDYRIVQILDCIMLGYIINVRLYLELD